MIGSQTIPRDSALKHVRRFIRKIIAVSGYEITRADKILKADTAAVYTSHYNRPVKVIADIGANTGQSIKTYCRLFPEAEIISFEPVSATYEKLAKLVAKTPKARAFQYALGAQPGTATIYVPPVNFSSTLLPQGAGHPSEEVKVETLDRVREQLGIDFIDLVKIDVEGFELDVIQGAERTLRTATGMVFAEVGLRDDNVFHIHVGRLYGALKPLGYRSFGLYDIKYWVGTPFANALFIHESHIKRS